MKSILVSALALTAFAAAADIGKRVGTLPPGMCVTATDTVVPCSSLAPSVPSQNTTCVTPEGKRTSCAPQSFMLPIPDIAPGFASTPDLTGTRWRIQLINREPALGGLNKPSLAFIQGAIHISTGCRDYSARILDPSEPTRFTITTEEVIAIACADPIERQEEALVKLIETATRIHLDDTNHLTLFSPNGDTLVAVTQ